MTDNLSPEDSKAVAELQDAWQDLANSMGAQPVIFDIDDETGERKTVWLGEWQNGPDAAKRADEITAAKMKEYEEIGLKAFEDTLPLENALKPGEVRISPRD